MSMTTMTASARNFNSKAFFRIRKTRSSLSSNFSDESEETAARREMRTFLQSRFQKTGSQRPKLKPKKTKQACFKLERKNIKVCQKVGRWRGLPPSPFLLVCADFASSDSFFAQQSDSIVVGRPLREVILNFMVARSLDFQRERELRSWPI